MDMVREVEGKKGYAAGFENMIQFILTMTPASEPIVGGFRKPSSVYSEITIRELVANALMAFPGYSPRSRNEDMAAIMRRLHICEEAGGGWDKAVIGCEEKHLTAPKMTYYEESVRVVISAKGDFSKMTSEEKQWACYLHACVLYVEDRYLTNATLRNRFGLGEESSASVSRVIKDALADGKIKPFDPETAKRYMKYVPFWA